jgi:hypothetical protein
MKLYEKFLSRLGLDLPVIEHSSNWSFLFRTYGDGWLTPFITMKVDWVCPENRVGYYQLLFHQPIHDGYSIRRFFEEYKQLRLTWDEYDTFFENWEVRRYIKPGMQESLEPVYGDDLVLRAWEVFVYTHDSWIAKQPSEFRMYVENVIDDTKSKDQRLAAYQNALIFMSNCEPSALRVWKNEIFERWNNNYAHWLGKFLTPEGKKA